MMATFFTSILVGSVTSESELDNNLFENDALRQKRNWTRQRRASFVLVGAIFQLLCCRRIGTSSQVQMVQTVQIKGETNFVSWLGR